MSWFRSAGSKIVEVLDEVATIRARMDAHDKETYRMLEEFKRLLGDLQARHRDSESASEARQGALTSKMTILEARLEAMSVQQEHQRERETALQARHDALTSKVTILEGKLEAITAQQAHQNDRQGSAQSDIRSLADRLSALLGRVDGALASASLIEAREGWRQGSRDALIEIDQRAARGTDGCVPALPALPPASKSEET